MVSTWRLGRIGAIGSVSAQFFHPRNQIGEKFPADMQVRLSDVIVTGEGMWLVTRTKQQLCYLVSILNVDGECHIVKHHFRVNVSPTAPFESKIAPPAAPAPQVVVDTDHTNHNDWWSTTLIDMFLGPPFRLNEFMALIMFTYEPPPTLAQGGFVDCFHDSGS
jgi:hypothetical protein